MNQRSAPPRWRTVLYYPALFGGLAVLAVAPFVVPTRPALMFLVIPLLALWAVWVLNEYWRWVRRLGR